MENIEKLDSPKELMRKLHPDLFSDSYIDDDLLLPQERFEYCLETLTNHKKEYEFEHFCRELAEREICPNLRIQTGPTGGGDSKVDTETYPVAEKIAEQWWVGSPSAASDRWAFAFSAKKKWKLKVKADVDNIVSTGRDYALIYFFTNQFAREKDRAKLEDSLSEHTGIPVRIMDRSWIVKKVYENDHLEMAIRTLNIESVQVEKRNRPGSRDASRLVELEELDRQVAETSRYRGARYQLAEDCLRSAILARNIDSPRDEVESRFDRAERLARKLEYRPQVMRISYARAWTAFWWYEDYSEFNRLYEEVELHVGKSRQIHEIQLLLNLWLLLVGSHAEKQSGVQDAKVESRRKSLASMLEVIASDSARPNSALRARTGLELIKIIQVLKTGQPKRLEPSFLELTQIVEESAVQGFYPVAQLFHTIKPLGEHVDSPAFDALYEKLVEAVEQQRGEGEVGRAYAERGEQKLRQEKFYEAIRWFGKAEKLLLKEEYTKELVMVLIASSQSYRGVNLLWVARNKLLAAVERTFSVFKEHGQFTLWLLEALEQLVWVELQLGRIPHILDAMTLADSVALNLDLTEENRKTCKDERHMQELVLCIHLLNLPFETLQCVTRLPNALARLHLPLARAALLYALGHEQILRDEELFSANEDPQTCFESWHDQPAAKDISPEPILVSEDTNLMKSTILGLEFIVEVTNNAVSFCVAESILGVLEGFLSTSFDALPCYERMKIVIKASGESTGVPQIRFLDGAGDRAEIIHPENITFATADEQHDYITWLRDSLIKIVSRMFMIQDMDAWIEKIVGQEQSFSRALNLGNSLLLTRNIFGATPKIHLDDWLEPDDRDYIVLRDSHWRKTKPSDSDETTESVKFSDATPSESLIDREEFKHKDYVVMSPIDKHLWDRAKWQGVLFLVPPEGPPVLAIVFEDGHAGQSIFRSWKEKWGKEDKNNELRLAIIKGVSKKNPEEYAIVLGPSFSKMNKDKEKLFIIRSVVRRMTPANPAGLDNFIKAYKKTGFFYMIPAGVEKNEPKEYMQLAIAKRKVVIRQACEIGANDPDKVVFYGEKENDSVI